MPDIAQQFTGLPLGLLVCEPILEVAKGQAALCDVYLEFVFKLAYEQDSSGKLDKTKTRVISFTLERPVTDGAGNMTTKSFTVQAPLLSLVPVPAFTMEEANVNFTMEVKDAVTHKDESSEAVDTQTGLSFWGCTANVSGKVATSRENTRQSDQSAKYEIRARALQHPAAEGMAKLTQVFASVIEPLETGSGG